MRCAYTRGAGHWRLLLWLCCLQKAPPAEAVKSGSLRSAASKQQQEAPLPRGSLAYVQVSPAEPSRKGSKVSPSRLDESKETEKAAPAIVTTSNLVSRQDTPPPTAAQVEEAAAANLLTLSPSARESRPPSPRGCEKPRKSLLSSTLEKQAPEQQQGGDKAAANTGDDKVAAKTEDPKPGPARQQTPTILEAKGSPPPSVLPSKLPSEVRLAPVSPSPSRSNIPGQ